ncbi:type II toxin-antitoxin system RelE/ParE family toxin [Megasphaera sp.]|uniref:type II toxin-antitoxin system RelE/ParE family toxin n=1 Tax=Megasphaera TaxID=906 RepID=UPI001DBE5D32|nr:type II toxin-antitoxin system RelE/ParE family toxin [Megasphaera sp.]MBS6789391.1 type II toxin-antitoxin system RelE/ParE family toxin [Megasphaera sp.]
MKVSYRNRKIEKVCTNAQSARKTYGTTMAEKIHKRIDQLRSADSVEMMIQSRIGRCHPLMGNRENQYALDLEHPYRLIFTKKGDEIQIAEVQEIIDYH